MIDSDPSRASPEEHADWTDEERRIVARGYLVGKSVRTIAREDLPHRHFGSICGIVSRMRKSGLWKQFLEEEWAKLKQSSDRPRPSLDKFFQPVAEIIPLPVKGRCSYADGDLHQGTLEYCTAPVVGNESYCLAHLLSSKSGDDRARTLERLIRNGGLFKNIQVKGDFVGCVQATLAAIGVETESLESLQAEYRKEKRAITAQIEQIKYDAVVSIGMRKQALRVLLDEEFSKRKMRKRHTGRPDGVRAEVEALLSALGATAIYEPDDRT